MLISFSAKNHKGCMDYQMYLLTEKGKSRKVSESLGEALELLAGD